MVFFFGGSRAQLDFFVDGGEEDRTSEPLLKLEVAVQDGGVEDGEVQYGQEDGQELAEDQFDSAVEEQDESVIEEPELDTGNGHDDDTPEAIEEVKDEDKGDGYIDPSELMGPQVTRRMTP